MKEDDRIFNCILSVLACAGEVDTCQVIVVENGSSESFRKRLCELPVGATLLTAPDAGVYAARNRGIEAAEGRVILFTDADCLVRPGWVRAALSRIEAGADIVQGFSGTSGKTAIDRMIQSRYAAHLRRRKPGEPTECDTRNLAVRREVFSTVRFNEDYRRVGDTEFGLIAESLGFRVSYEPRMVVDHVHEPDVRLFAAKQVCHGWGAQRLMQQHPEIRWHGGHLFLVSRWSRRGRHLPGGGRIGIALARTTVGLGGLLQRVAQRLPFPVAVRCLGAIDKAAGLAGHLMFAPDEPEPSPSQLLKKPARD